MIDTRWMLATLTACAIAATVLQSAPSAAADDTAQTPEAETMSAMRWPRTRSKAPSFADWKDAKPLALNRNRDGACSAKRIREWVQIRCEGFGHSGDSPMIAGNKGDVSMWIANRDQWPAEPAVVVVMPVRVGDRRVFQVNGQFRWSTFPVATISELWLDDQSEPVIVVTPL